MNFILNLKFPSLLGANIVKTSLLFILRDLLHPLQTHFLDTGLGRERALLFVYTLLSIIVPFTSSMTSNCLL